MAGPTGGRRHWWGGGLVEQISSSYLKVTFDRETAVRDNPESEARIISWEWIEG